MSNVKESTSLNQYLTQIVNESSTDGELIENLAYLAGSRGALFPHMSFNENRDIDKECHYPKTSQLTVLEYKDYYERFGIAERVVNLWPSECWNVPPTVYETDDTETNTEFEAGWRELSEKLNGQSSRKFEEGNSYVWKCLQDLDEVSGIGHYGVLFLGLSDVGTNAEGKAISLAQEATPESELLYLRCFDESQAKIASWEQDETNPRFGLPTAYNITFQAVEEGSTGTTIGSTKLVHWTRVIHVADNLKGNQTFGKPRMRPVFNRLIDMRKLYGPSAEMFWQGAFQGPVFSTHPSLGTKVDIDPGLAEQVDNWRDGLRRQLALKGMQASTLDPNIVNPNEHIKVQIEFLCIVLRCPVRIFMGSERGELASSQDERAWNKRVSGRQENYVTPNVICTFIDRLIQLGILPEPVEGYVVKWPDLDATTEEEQTTTGHQLVEALAKYVQGDVGALIDPKELLVRVFKKAPEEAEALLLDEGQLQDLDLESEGDNE